MVDKEEEEDDGRSGAAACTVGSCLKSVSKTSCQLSMDIDKGVNYNVMGKKKG